MTLVKDKWDKPTDVGAVNVYILYDRSGSMASREREAVPALNSYVRALSPLSVVTVVAFDSNDVAQMVRDHVTVSAWWDITIPEVSARGGTPLYDAVGNLANKIMNVDNPSRAVLVVQTDGEENHSREWNYSSINSLMDKFRQRGYQVVFLGSEFKNVAGTARAFGVTGDYTLNRSAGFYGDVSASLAAKTMNYATRGVAMSYTADEKIALGDTDTIAEANTPVASASYTVKASVVPEADSTSSAN